MGWWDSHTSPEFKENVGDCLPLFAGKISRENSLCQMIEDHLVKVQEEVPRRVDRKDGWHPSSFGNVCRRFETLKRSLPIVNDRKRFSADLLRRFQLGHAVHDRFQLDILSKMRVLKGRYVCSRCTREVKNTLMPHDPCPHCRWQVNDKMKPAPASRKSKDCAAVCSWPSGYDSPTRDCTHCERGGRWLFKESWIFIDEWDIVGRYDGIILKGGDEFVLELKSKDTFAWANLLEPDESHVLQSNFYMWGTGIHKAIIAYVDKNSGKLKEFEVQFNQKLIDRALRDVTAVRKALEAGELPLGPCGSPRQKRAKECAYKRTCFMGEENIEKLRNRLREKEEPK